MATVKSFELAPPGPAVNLLLIATAVLPALIVAGIWAGNPAAFEALPAWALVSIILLSPMLIGFGLLHARNPRIELDAGHLTLRLGLIRKRWPPAELQSAQARLLDLDRERDWQPRWKLFGAALPGLQSGLFRLRNGRNARVYLTARQSVVLVPTQRGPILLSLVRPRDFLAALQST